jgi:hypothetical protein
MADKKKYLDFEGLSFYHQKSQELVDKKINWDNLKNKPFGTEVTKTNTLVKATVSRKE